MPITMLMALLAVGMAVWDTHQILHLMVLFLPDMMLGKKIIFGFHLWQKQDLTVMSINLMFGN